METTDYHLYLIKNTLWLLPGYMPTTPDGISGSDDIVLFPENLLHFKPELRKYLHVGAYKLHVQLWILSFISDRNIMWID
jgi:hypothetical protein